MIAAPSRSQRFLALVPAAPRARLEAAIDLDRALGHLLDTARTAWPDLDVDEDVFLEFIARRVAASAEPERALGELRVADLYLTCAYGRGHPAAAAAIETRYLPSVAATLRRMGVVANVIQDVTQVLHLRLLASCDATSASSGYGGRGELLGWLRVAAIREARRIAGRALRERALDDEVVEGATLSADPELSFIREEHRAEFKAAFREALAALSSRDRNLLRYYFVRELNVDRIGAIYRVHRATAARWIAGVRERLLADTRTGLMRRLGITRQDCDSLLRVVGAQLDSSLRVLLDPEEEEGPAEG